MKAWFETYLHKRQIEVRVRGDVSERRYTKFGVATGSVYGPSEYKMHVNSMSNVIKKCNIYMFADNTSLIYSR